MNYLQKTKQQASSLNKRTKRTLSMVKYAISVKTTDHSTNDRRTHKKAISLHPNLSVDIQDLATDLFCCETAVSTLSSPSPPPQLWLYNLKKRHLLSLLALHNEANPPWPREVILVFKLGRKGAVRSQLYSWRSAAFMSFPLSHILSTASNYGISRIVTQSCPQITSDLKN